MSVSTITLQNILNLCSTHTDLMPLTGVGGFTNEPGLSLCIDAASEIINDEHDWKFNSIELGSVSQPLITMMNKQDYLFAGASAFVLSSGSAGSQSSGAASDLSTANAITVSGGVVTRQYAGVSPFHRWGHGLHDRKRDVHRHHGEL